MNLDSTKPDSSNSKYVKTTGGPQSTVVTAPTVQNGSVANTSATDPASTTTAASTTPTPVAVDRPRLPTTVIPRE